MTPEQLIAVAPSVVAIVVAALSFAGTLVQGKRTERQLRDQSDAADKRERDRIAADERRWRAEMDEGRAAREASVTEGVLSRERDSRDRIARERAEQLRVTAGEFFTVVGEAAHALRKVGESVALSRAESLSLSEQNCFEPWTSQDIERRLSISTVKLGLFGTNIRTRANTLEHNIRFELEELRKALDGRGQVSIGSLEFDITEVAETVTASLWERTSEHPTPPSEELPA